MSGNDMERLAALDERYSTALTEHDRLKIEYQAASEEVQDALGDRRLQYQETFKQGIVIEAIAHHRLLRYKAGYGGEYDVDYGWPSVWVALDAAHAASLEGVVVPSPRIGAPDDWFWENGSKHRKARGHDRRTDLGIEFTIPGVHRNERLPRLKKQTSAEETAYKGLLRAVQWRLATEEDLQQAADNKDTIGAAT